MKYKQKSSSEETTQISITNPEPLTHSLTNSQHSSQAKAKLKQSKQSKQS